MRDNLYQWSDLIETFSSNFRIDAATPSLFSHPRFFSSSRVKKTNCV